MRQNYGAELNFSYVENEEGCHGGMHMTDSEGLDFSTEHSGKSITEIIQNLYKDALKELVKQRENKQPEKSPKEEGLENRIAELEKQLAAAKAEQKKIQSKATATPKEKEELPDLNDMFDIAVDKIVKRLNDLDKNWFLRF